MKLADIVNRFNQLLAEGHGDLEVVDELNNELIGVSMDSQFPGQIELQFEQKTVDGR